MQVCLATSDPDELLAIKLSLTVARLLSSSTGVVLDMIMAFFRGRGTGEGRP